MISLWASRSRERLREIAPQQLLVAIDRLQSQHLSGDGPNALFDDLLSDLLALTNSTTALFAEVHPGSGGHPELGRLHGADAPELVGVLRQVLHSGQPVFSQLIELEDETRLWRLDRPASDLLGLPLAHAGVMTGAVVLMGRPGGYDEDLLDFLRPLLLTATVVLQAQHQHREFRHHAEQLRHTEQKLRDVFASLNDVAWSFTLPDGRMVYLSPGAEEVYGIPTSDLLANPNLFNSMVHPDDIDEVIRTGQEVLQTGSGGHIFRIIRPDGAVRWVRRRACVVYNEFGQAIRVMGTHTDITDLKLMEEALLESQARLEQMVEERTALLKQEVSERLQVERKSEEQLTALEERRQLEGRIQEAMRRESLAVLAGGIAHEFNNVLTSILGFADLTLSQLGPASPLSGFVEQIIRGSQRAAQLTRQMLAYSGQGRFVIQPVQLDEMIRDTIPLLRATVARNCIIRDELTASMPAVMGDSTQLRQLILNLVLNASEALGERIGSATLRCGLCEGGVGEGPGEETLPPGRYAFIEVEDDGGGMTPEVRERIFDPFFSTKFTGRGLGLSAVQGIVRGHRGAIRVQTVAGQGSRFRVLLPCGVPTSAEVPVLRNEPSSLKPGTLLVVDDEANVRTLVARILARYGWIVHQAAGGRQALELYRTHAQQIDVVLLDLVMPSMSGAEVLQELRRIRPDVRLVLTSGYALRPSLQGLKVEAFLAKPFRAEELVEMLASVRSVQ